MDTFEQSESRAAAFERHHALLFTIAYRMTGSAGDAEDLVQETWLRYQASAPSDIVSLKAYLTTIVTRLALDMLKSARAVREQYVGDWLPEPILTADESGLPLVDLERRELLSLAFLRLLESLSPPERAVFLLHEVFGYSFGEVGAMLEKSPANCRQIFHRAKEALEAKRARFEAEPERQSQLLRGFLSASQAGDIEALTSLLAQDVVSWSDGGGKVQTSRKPVLGQESVARFWTFWLSRSGVDAQSLTYTTAEINGSPAVLCWDGDRLGVVICLSIGPSGIEEIDAQLNPDKLAYLQKQLANSNGKLLDAIDPSVFTTGNQKEK